MRYYHGTNEDFGSEFDMAANPSDIGVFFTPNVTRIVRGDFCTFKYVYAIDINPEEIYEVSTSEAQDWVLERLGVDSDELEDDDEDEHCPRNDVFQFAENVAGGTAWWPEWKPLVSLCNEVTREHDSDWASQAVALLIAQENGCNFVYQNDEYGDSISTNSGTAKLVLVRNNEGNFKHPARA